MKYEVVMGLEVHVELATESKLFCSCSAKFGADANENVCPACAGMPGLLPVANKKAIEYGIKAAIVTNSKIPKVTTFDKKNYFYPDLSTGHQITQLFAPVCTDGYVDIETSEGGKRINLKQIHIEEDAGKLVHMPSSNASLVDYNRASVPLIEIVSMPDFRTSDEVIAYLERLRLLLVYAGVSDCKMQEGSMRADINISVREQGDEKLGTRVEIKNMNSLKAITRAIEYEAERHIEAIETGCEVIVQETRRWDDNKNMSFAMRNKEDATDYRYFPNPDLMPIYIDDEWINEIKLTIPELAHEKYERFQTQFGLSEYDSKILTSSKNLSEIFEETVNICNQPKEVANWFTGELMNLLNTKGVKVDDLAINSSKVAKLIDMVSGKAINRNMAKEILAKIYEDDIDPQAYVKEHGLSMVSDEDAIKKACEEVVADNPKTIAEYKGGSTKVMGFLIGNVMKKMAGKANPQVVTKLLKEIVDKL